MNRALGVLIFLLATAALSDTSVNRTCTQLVDAVKSQCDRCRGPGLVAIDIASNELETICEGVGGDPECEGNLSTCHDDKSTLQGQYDTCTGSLSNCTTARDTAQSTLGAINTFNENMQFYYSTMHADLSTVGDVCVDFDTGGLDLLCVFSYLSKLAPPVSEADYGPPFETISVFQCAINILGCKLKCLAGAYWDEYAPGTTTGCLQNGNIGLTCNTCFSACATQTSIHCT